MMLYALVFVTLLFSNVNGFILHRIGEELHNAVNSVIPHEHRLLPLGRNHHHHHHEGPPHSYEEGGDPPDYRRPPTPHPPPPHRFPEHNGSEDREPFYEENKETATTESVIQVDTTTATVEESEISTVIAIDVRSAPDVSSRRLINPGNNCGDGQRADGLGRCRAVFG